MADPYHHFLNFNNSCAIDSFLELAQFTFFHDLCSKEKGELMSLVANSCALRHDAGKNMSKKLLFDIREAVWKWIESNCPSFAGRTSNASFEEILDHICTTSDESDLFSVKSSCRYICSTPGCNAFKVREKRECPVYVFQPQLNDHNNDMGATLSSMFSNPPSSNRKCDTCQVRSLECSSRDNFVRLPEYLFVRVPTVNRNIGGIQQLVVMDGIIVPEVIDFANGQKYIFRGAVRGIGRHFTTAVKIDDKFVHIDGNDTNILTAPSLTQLANAVKQQYYSSVTKAPKEHHSDVHSYQTKSIDGYFLFMFSKDSSMKYLSPPLNVSHAETSSSSTEVIRETFIESSCVPNIPVRNSYQLLTDEAETSHETVASQIIQVTPVRAHTTNCAKEKTKRKLLPSSPPPSKKINSSSKKLNSSSKKCILKLENVTKGCDPKVTLKSKNVSDSDNASIPLNDITNVTQQKGPSVQFCDYVVIQNGRLFVDIQLLNSMNLLGKQWKRSRLLNRVKYYGFDSTTEVIDINCINFISLKVFIVLLFKSNFCEQTLRQNTCTEILTLLNKAAMANNTSKWASFSVHTELDENQLYVDMNVLYSLLDVKTKRIRPLLPGLKRLALSDDHFIFDQKIHGATFHLKHLLGYYLHISV